MIKTTLDKIIALGSKGPEIKKDISPAFYQRGIYQWWHKKYGCIYVGINALDTNEKNNGMPLRALHHTRKLLNQISSNTRQTKKWLAFSKIFNANKDSYSDIEIHYENHPHHSKKELEQLEKDLVNKHKPITNH